MKQAHHRYHTQVFPWYRIKAWNCAILRRGGAHSIHLHAFIRGKRRMSPKVERRQCDQRRLDVRNASGTRFYESSLAIDKSLYSVFLSSPSLSLSLALDLSIPLPACISPSWILWFRIVPRDLEHRGVEKEQRGDSRDRVRLLRSVKIQNRGRASDGERRRHATS